MKNATFPPPLVRKNARVLIVLCIRIVCVVLFRCPQPCSAHPVQAALSVPITFKLFPENKRFPAIDVYFYSFVKK